MTNEELAQWLEDARRSCTEYPDGSVFWSFRLTDEKIKQIVAALRDTDVGADLLTSLKQLVADYEDVPDPTDLDGQLVFAKAREAIAKAEAA
jgi:hypothetical protein